MSASHLRSVALVIVLGATQLAYSASAYAQPSSESTVATTTSLTLGQVLESVERSFPLLNAAKVELDVAAGETLSAIGGFDATWKTRISAVPIGYYDGFRIESTLERPVDLWGASAFAGWRLGTGKFASYDGKLQTLEFGEFRAGVNVPLVRNGPIDRRRATIGRAELGQEVAKLTVAEQKIVYRRNAAIRYWNWVASGKRLDVANQLLRMVLDRDAAITTRVAKGDLPAIERVDNARAIAQRRGQVASATRAIEQASIELGLYFRDAAGNPVLPSKDALPPDFPAFVAQVNMGDVATALTRRPEAKRFGLQAQQQSIEERYARNQLQVGLDLQAAVSQDLGRSISARPDLQQTVLELSLLVDIPIETRQFRGRRDSAAAANRRLTLQQQFAYDRIRADVRDAQSALRAVLQRHAAAAEEAKLAEQLEEAERTRFNQGDSTMLILNLREQQAAEAEVREIDARADYWRTLADAAAARGE
jgi:outer membrane protein, heavy metal efflux system